MDKELPFKVRFSVKVKPKETFVNEHEVKEGLTHKDKDTLH